MQTGYLQKEQIWCLASMQQLTTGGHPPIPIQISQGLLLLTRRKMEESQTDGWKTAPT